MAFLAACVFAAGSVKAARIRAASELLSRSGGASKPYPDLRATLAATQSEAQINTLDFIESLEDLRSRVRSAISALAPSECTADGAVGAGLLSHERIVSVQLDKTALPPNASKGAQELLEALRQQMETLNTLLSKKAAASDISNILIKVHTTARNLALILTKSSDERTAPPPALKQH